MASGLISGVLGGFKGAGSAVAVMADEQRKALAERLKAQYEEEAQIRSEGRSLKNQKELVKFGNEQPMSIADTQKMGMEQKNKLGQLSVEQQNKIAEIKASGATEQEVNAARIKMENAANLSEIAATGEEYRKTASVKGDVDPKVVELEERKAKELFAVKLQQNNIPVSFDPESGAISGEGLTTKQQDSVKKMAKAFNLEVSFGEESEVDNPGLLTGNSVVKGIGSVVYTGSPGKVQTESTNENIDDEATLELKSILADVTSGEREAPKSKGMIGSKMKPDKNKKKLKASDFISEDAKKVWGWKGLLNR